jgi:hypothetical protein
MDKLRLLKLLEEMAKMLAENGIEEEDDDYLLKRINAEIKAVKKYMDAASCF